MTKGKSFFSTLPGVVSGIAALLTGIVGLLTVAVQLGWIGGDDDGAGVSSSDTTATSVAGGGTGGGTGGSGGRSTGSTAAGRLTVDKTTLTFVPLQTKEQTVRVTNQGSAPVTLRPPSFTGDADQYSAAYANCPTPLPPNASCVVTVTFRPTEAGRSSAILTIAPSSGATTAVEVKIDGNHIL